MTDFLLMVLGLLGAGLLVPVGAFGIVQSIKDQSALMVAYASGLFLLGTALAALGVHRLWGA